MAAPWPSRSKEMVYCLGTILLFLAPSIAQAYRPEDVLVLAATAAENITELEIQFFPSPPSTDGMVRHAGRLGQQLGLGRCPDAQVGCYDPVDDRLLGCCQEDQTCAMQYGPFPQQTARFLGCVDDPLQLCYDKMCPPGYGCCRSNMNIRRQRQVFPWAFCVPLPTGLGWTFDPAVYGPFPDNVREAMGNFSSYCGDSVEVVPNGPSFAQASTLLQPWTLFNTSTAPYVATTCSGPVGGYCAVGDACNLQNITIGSNETNPIAQVSEEETYCCPTDQTLCLKGRPPFDQWPVDAPLNATSSFYNTQFLGCAIDDRSETCCGSSICGGASKCCVAYQASNYTDINTNVTYAYNSTLTSFCCPDQAHCCYGQPFDPLSVYLNEGPYGSQATLPEVIPGNSYGYCGYTYGGNPCGIDINVPQGWLFGLAIMYPAT